MYQLDWLPGGDKAPIYSGIQEGFFKEQGIKIKISSGRGSTDALTKLATRRSDIGSAGLGALLSAKAQQNIPVTAVASIFTKGPHAFLSYEGSGIRSLSDVKHKSIATSPFTSSNVFLPLVLKQIGLSKNDIKLVHTDPATLGPMLTTGKTDAIIAWMTDLYRYQNQLDKRNKKLVVIPWSESGMDIYGISLVASDHFLTKQPELALRFVKAFIKSIKFVNAHPQVSAKHVHTMVEEVSVESALAAILQFNKLSNNEIRHKDGIGIFDLNRLRNTWDWVAEAQALDKHAFEPESAITHDFLGERVLPSTHTLGKQSAFIKPNTYLNAE